MKRSDNYLTSVEEKRIQEYITRHAMVSLGILKNAFDPEYEIYTDKFYLFGMLIGVLNNEDDRLNARKALDQVESMGYHDDEDNLVYKAQEIRLKCNLELFVLNIALDLLYRGKEAPSVVFAKVCQLLK